MTRIESAGGELVDRQQGETADRRREVERQRRAWQEGGEVAAERRREAQRPRGAREESGVVAAERPRRAREESGAAAVGGERNDRVVGSAAAGAGGA